MSTFKVDKEQVDNSVETLRKLLEECEEAYTKEIPESTVDKGHTHNELSDLCNNIKTTCYYLGELINNTILFLGKSSKMFEISDKESAAAIMDQVEGSFLSLGIYGNVASNSEESGSTLWAAIKDEISGIPDDAKSAGEALGWIEKEYGKLPHWATLGMDVLVPSSLQDAYTITSGILQGNLKLEVIWDTAKSILSKSTTFAVVSETLDYTFGTGTKRSEETERQLLERLGEGGIIGAAFDLTEGVVDTLIGGAVDVLGDVGGGAVDKLIDNVPIVKGINKLTEYGTGLLGWNGGEGYSVGGLIGATTEKISEGLDAVTDVVTDAIDFVTDTLTDGFNLGVNWVKSWFD